MDLFKSIYGENEEYSENKIMMILKRFRKKLQLKLLKIYMEWDINLVF